MTAIAATVGLVSFVVLTPVLVALAVAVAVADRSITGEGSLGSLTAADLSALAAAAVAASLWVPGVVAVVAELRGRDRGIVRLRAVPPTIRRAVAATVETSLFGVGTLSGWTSTRVDGSLDDLVLPAPARTPEPVVEGAGAGADTGVGPEEAPRPAADAPESTVRAVEHVVQRGETWRVLAERYLGDGRRFADLKDLNVGRRQGDGAVVRRDDVLRPGWVVLVPDAEP